MKYIDTFFESAGSQNWKEVYARIEQQFKKDKNSLFTTWKPSKTRFNLAYSTDILEFDITSNKHYVIVSGGYDKKIQITPQEYEKASNLAKVVAEDTIPDSNLGGIKVGTEGIEVSEKEKEVSEVNEILYSFFSNYLGKKYKFDAKYQLVLGIESEKKIYKTIGLEIEELRIVDIDDAPACIIGTTGVLGEDIELIISQDYLPGIYDLDQSLKKEQFIIASPITEKSGFPNVKEYHLVPTDYPTFEMLNGIVELLNI